MWCCFRNAIVLKRLILSLCYSKEYSVYRYSTLINLPDSVFAVHKETITCTNIDDTITKHKLRTLHNCARLSDSESAELILGPYEQPWVWIGNGEINMTAVLKPYLVPGNKITLGLLNREFPAVEHWQYMNASLDILDFPAQGITIR